MSHHLRFPLALLTAITLALSACATGSDVDVTIHESERGVVYVERIPDRSFQAAHPITLSVDTMAHVLRGVLVRENRGFLGNMIFGKNEAVRVFRDEDVQFLSPLLVDGLTRAASDQQVGFRVVQTGVPWGSTKGSLYAYGRSLYLTLPSLAPQSRQGVGGVIESSSILFSPESAKRPDTSRDARSTEWTLVIDYALLASLPADSVASPVQVPPGGPAAATGQTTAPAKATQTIQTPVEPKDRELDDVRKELQDIKRRLAEQDAERSVQKQNGPSK
jgi:hypothetical protein